MPDGDGLEARRASASSAAVGAAAGSGEAPGATAAPVGEASSVGGLRAGPLDEVVARLAVRAAAVIPVGRRTVVVVDGRSGTGKTTLGNALAARLGAQIVHLDDIYPGWDGLRAASEAVVTDVLGSRAGYRRWDWATSEPADWRPVDPRLPLVLEGCGALSRASAPLADLRIWLDADDAVRRERAINRDGEVFEREWERWAAQEWLFIEAEDPASLADVVLRT